MKLPPFKLEEFFADHEFTTEISLTSSDPETHSLNELLSFSDDECKQLWNNLDLSYTESYGLPLLREEISKLYTSQKSENILVFSGAEEAIFIAIQTLIEKNDHVIVITPCYESLKVIPETLGADVSTVSLKWDRGKWFFDINSLKNCLIDDTRLFIINFPHNPTGYLPSISSFKEILDLARQCNAYVLSDEVYRFSEYDEKDRLPAAVDYYDKAISIGVMSKSFGLPGLRIGWTSVNDEKLLGKFAAYKNYTTICNSAPSEILALIALRNKNKLLKRTLTISQNNLDLLENFFNKYNSLFQWSRPKSGFMSFPKFTSKIPIDNFTDSLRKEENVLILPGTLFDDNNNHFRLGFGRNNFPLGIKRMEKFILRSVLKDS